VGIDVLLVFKAVLAVDARTKKDLKSSGERVLVNGGCSDKPIVDIDVKPL
jgi:hypothetical protein